MIKELSVNENKDDDKIVFFPKLPKECAEILRGCPDGLELEELCSYVKENPDIKNAVLIHLCANAATFDSAILAILTEKTVSEVQQYKHAEAKHQKNNNSQEYTFSDNNKNNSGFVYLANLDNEKGLIKIGKTNNITQRESTFVTGNIHLKIFAYVQCENPYELENYLHKFFKNKQVKNEWFSLTEDDVQLLVELFDFKIAVETK